mgnify:CR=1 FL=1
MRGACHSRSRLLHGCLLFLEVLVDGSTGQRVRLKKYFIFKLKTVIKLIDLSTARDSTTLGQSNSINSKKR